MGSFDSFSTAGTSGTEPGDRLRTLRDVLFPSSFQPCRLHPVLTKFFFSNFRQEDPRELVLPQGTTTVGRSLVNPVKLQVIISVPKMISSLDLLVVNCFMLLPMLVWKCRRFEFLFVMGSVIPYLYVSQKKDIYYGDAKNYSDYYNFLKCVDYF